MKKVMQNKSLLHRLIALTMAVVMTLTLVAIDSHFHLFAEEEDIQTIDVTAIVKGDKADMVYGFKDFDKAIKFKIKSDKVDGIDSSKLGVAVYKGATADDKIATATDAAGKLVTFDNVYELKNDTAVQKIAIYYYTGTDESGDFELLGTIKVAVDKQAPTISVEADDNPSFSLTKDIFISTNESTILATMSTSATSTISGSSPAKYDLFI